MNVIFRPVSATIYKYRMGDSSFACVTVREQEGGTLEIFLECHHGSVAITAMEELITKLQEALTFVCMRGEHDDTPTQGGGEE